MISEYVPFPGDWQHQTFAVSEMVRWANAGKKRFCVSSPTGGGKSKVMERGCTHFANDGMFCGVMSNRKLLTMQLLRGLTNAGIRVGCRAAEFEAWTDLGAPVQVISGPTEIARVLNRRKKTGEDLELPPFNALFVDEAHLQKGDETRVLLDELTDRHGTIIVGITATPLGISQIYRDGLIVAGNNSELRRCGALVAATCFEPAVLDLPKVRKSKTGLFSQAEMEESVRAIWSQHVVGHVFDHWRKLNPEGLPTLGMAPGVPESRGLAQEFFRRGISTAHIDGEGMIVNGREYSTTAQEDRDEVFAMSKDGRLPMLWNRFVLREGVDLKWLHMLTLATPIASLLSYIQVIGRVLRANAGKTGAVIVDHCGSIRMHGSPNLDRDDDWKQYFFEDENKITKDRQERLTSPKEKEPEPITCPECGMIRKEGRVCPHCKFEHAKSVRKVIQESGELKKMTGDVYPRRRVGVEKPETLKNWERVFYSSKNSNQTFRQAMARYTLRHGCPPPDNLPGMPKDPCDLSRRIKDVPYKDLIPRRD